MREGLGYRIRIMTFGEDSDTTNPEVSGFRKKSRKFCVVENGSSGLETKTERIQYQLTTDLTMDRYGSNPTDLLSNAVIRRIPFYYQTTS